MKRIFFLCLLFPILVNAQFTNSGTGSWQNTPDLKSWRIAFGSRGIVYLYQKYQVDSGFVKNGYAPQAASFNITKSGTLDSTLTINSGSPGYTTSLNSNNNNTDVFDIKTNGTPVLTFGNPRFSAVGAFEFLTLGSTTTLINNLFGSVTLHGSIGSTGGIGRGTYLNNTVYAGANNDVVAGLVVQDTLSNGTPITALDNGSLVAGSGYTPGTYTVNFTNSNNHYGATGSIVVGGGGTVTSATYIYAGYNYQVGDVLKAVFGGGSGFSIQVLTVGAYTGVKKIGSVVYGGMQLVPTTYSGLPAVPIEGTICAVTDSNTAVWGATAAGSGSNHVLLYWDGSNWTVFAK